MPVQKITLTIETEAIDEEARPELAVELLRKANAVLAAHLASRDSLQGDVKWEEK